MQWESRHQQKKAKKRYDIIYPKFKKGEYSVREVNVGCIYGISSFIFSNQYNTTEKILKIILLSY